MLKLRIALVLALIAAVITAVVGAVQGARATTILYRTLVSLAVFGGGAYLAGKAAEQYLLRLADVKPKGQKIDITSKDASLGPDELLNPSYAEQQFSPFIPEKPKKNSTQE